jgi:XTP/dITP diphosphohydrolase
MLRLLLATRNAHKTREFAQLLGDDFEVTDLSGIANAPRVEETGHTFEENAILKVVGASRCDARTAQRAVPTYVVADDSGLEVDVLDGAPGIYSARYAGENATDEQNIDRLLRELAARNASGDERSARFRCVIALARQGKLLNTFEGTAEGAIVDQPRGKRGFGYDPIFMPKGFDKTFGELPAEIKNRISHRAKAIAAIRNFPLSRS